MWFFVRFLSFLRFGVLVDTRVDIEYRLSLVFCASIELFYNNRRYRFFGRTKVSVIQKWSYANKIHQLNNRYEAEAEKKT